MGQSPFGRASKFGFKNPFQLFDLLENVSVLPATKLSIRSVSATLPYSIRKTRYLSSTYRPPSPHTRRLIIGRSSHLRALGKAFSMDFMELRINRASDSGGERVIGFWRGLGWGCCQKWRVAGSGEGSYVAGS